MTELTLKSVTPDEIALRLDKIVDSKIHIYWGNDDTHITFAIHFTAPETMGLRTTEEILGLIGYYLLSGNRVLPKANDEPMPPPIEAEVLH